MKRVQMAVQGFVILAIWFLTMTATVNRFDAIYFRSFCTRYGAAHDLTYAGFDAGGRGTSSVCFFVTADGRPVEVSAIDMPTTSSSVLGGFRRLLYNIAACGIGLVAASIVVGFGSVVAGRVRGRGGNEDSPGDSVA
jgi:hypothetical protein